MAKDKEEAGQTAAPTLQINTPNQGEAEGDLTGLSAEDLAALKQIEGDLED